MRRFILAVGVLASSLLAAAPGTAASFDCARARAADERAICADRHLNDQDVRMATWLEVLGDVQLMGANGAMRDDQIAWLANRHKCGGDRVCLSHAYDRRLHALNGSYAAWAAKFH